MNHPVLTSIFLASLAVGDVHSEPLGTQAGNPAAQREQFPLAKNDAGLWRLPGGDKAYANTLRRFTTTELTAPQIHEIGLKEVARIGQEMDALFRQLG